MSLQGKRTVVAGGASGIGLATALLFQQAGARVTVTGRSTGKLDTAKKNGLQTAQVDSSNPVALEAFFTVHGDIDHLVIALGGNKGVGNFRDLSLDDLRTGFEEKYWPHLYTLKAALPYMSHNGSITLITAISGTAEMPGTSGIGSMNGALEIFVPILAKELKPLRINAVSPGLVDTPWWDFMPADAKKQAFESYTQYIAVGRVAQPEEIAQTISFLAENEYMTGKVVACDGGLG